MKMAKFKSIEVDLPVLNKFLFCLPLRPGLVICGYGQLMATLLFSWLAIADFAEKSHRVSGFMLVEMIIMFVLTMTLSLMEIIFSMFLVLGARRKNANFLEVCYYYLRAKLILFTVLMIVNFLIKMFVHYHYWYDRNLDPWLRFSLMEDQAVGIIVLALQFYLLLLIRSDIIKLEHQMDISTLYKRFYTTPEQNATVQQDIKVPL